MKKTLVTLLVLTLTCTMLLAGCGQSTPSASPSAAAPSAETGSEPSAAETPSEAPAASDYEWPTRPVNVMCPAAAGGGTDMMLRIISEYFTKLTGQTFVINNVTGITGYEQVHQGDTDGYDFILGTTTIFTSKIDGTLDYDWSDYEMVAFVPGSSFTCVAVQADSPYQTINDLFDAAAANPEDIAGGITLSGQPYMFAKALKAALGIDLYFVDTGTTSERNAALLGGQVDYIITNYPSSQAYVESGDFRVLAMDGNERYPLAPDVPTFKEQGVDFCFVAQPAIWLAPKGTPAEACEAFNSILHQIYDDPNLIEDMLAIKSVTHPIPSIEESKRLSQEFVDALSPYID